VVEVKMGERRKLKEQPWYVRINFYAIVFAILFFLFIIYASTRDYEPFRFYGWRNVPDIVCPLEPFDSGYVSEVRAGPYSIGEMEGAATMLDEDGKVVDSWAFEPINLEPYPKQLQTSVAVRSAPITPGVYRFGLVGKIPGRMFFLIPTYQEVDEKAVQKVEVLPLDSKQCERLIREG
jgi:hypothetical protein